MISSISPRNHTGTHTQFHATRHEGQPLHGDSSGRGLPKTLEAESIQHESRKPTRLKLGGWQPRKDIPNGPGVMTWEKFNAMLLKVGRAREQANKSETRI